MDCVMRPHLYRRWGSVFTMNLNMLVSLKNSQKLFEEEIAHGDKRFLLF